MVYLLLCGLLLMPKIWTEEKRPLLLIIGDSINGHYTPTVELSLAKYFQVHHNPGNAKSTAYSLQHIEEWLTQGNGNTFI